MPYNNYTNPYQTYYSGQNLNNFSQVIPTSVSGNNIIWVTNQQEAESYPISTGSTILMMERNANKFYIKSVNQYGVAMPLEAYSFEPIASKNETVHNSSNNAYVTKEEFNELKKMLEDLTSPNKKG